MRAPLRLGLIGCGHISRDHRNAIRAHPDTAALAAACDVDDQRARAAAADADGCQVFTDWARMVREAALDGVIICLPHAQHLEVGLTALERGVHALIEKPMACTAAQGEQLVNTAARSGVVLMAGQHQRYEPTYRAIRRMVQGGVLGKIHAARFDCMQTLRAYAAPPHWFFDGDIAGGGVVISLAVHRLDLLRFLLNDEVIRVEAVTRRYDPAFLHGAEDYAAGTLTFAQGPLADFFAAYSAYRSPYGESFMIFGERGSVHALPTLGTYVGPAFVAAASLPGITPIQQFVDQYSGFVPVAPDQQELPTANPFENELLHFVDCCQTGARPLSDGRDNVRTLAVVDAVFATRNPAIRYDN